MRWSAYFLARARERRRLVDYDAGVCGIADRKNFRHLKPLRMKSIEMPIGYLNCYLVSRLSRARSHETLLEPLWTNTMGFGLAALLIVMWFGREWVSVQNFLDQYSEIKNIIRDQYVLSLLIFFFHM